MQALAAVLAAATTTGALGACGSSDSDSSSTRSKPSYCDQRDALKSDVQNLTDIKLRDDGLGAIRKNLDQIRSDAEAVVASGKSDFPDEVNAMQRSLDNLRTTVQNTSSSPSAQDVVFIGSGVAAVATSVSAFVDAAGGKC
jgi:hypothetical protein